MKGPLEKDTKPCVFQMTKTEIASVISALDLEGLFMKENQRIWKESAPEIESSKGKINSAKVGKGLLRVYSIL